MKTQTIPALQIEPDLFGKLNINVAIEGYDATPNGVLKWIADAARLNLNFRPSLASRDVAERLNISRRTLEGYRTGIKVPVVVCWLLRSFLEEIRDDASGLVLSSTPSETVSGSSADETAPLPGMMDVVVATVEAMDDDKKRRHTKKKVTAIKKRDAAETKTKSAKKKRVDAPKKKKTSPKKSKTTKSKSKSSK
jgi:hypothetical protein